MWTDKDIQFLRDNPTMSIPNLATALGKSESAVRSKRSRLGIHSGVATHPWTRDERLLLQQKYSTATKEELMKLLPGRSWNAINSQVYWLRKRQWNI